jgi:hypothetical protein
MTLSIYRSSLTAVLLGVGVTAVAAGCGGDGATAPAPAGGSPPPAAAAPAHPSGLSADELEKGIGPIRSVALGPIDETLAELSELSPNVRIMPATPTERSTTEPHRQLQQ